MDPLCYFWNSPQDYLLMGQAMGGHVSMMRRNQGSENLWFLEHFPLYTQGAGCHDAIPGALPFPFFPSTRGGKITFHGPGQRIIYVMIDLKKRGLSLHQYIFLLEQWIIDVLYHYGLQAERFPPHTGVWLGKAKIAAIGLYVQGGITSHGIALNVTVSLEPFSYIIPCGLFLPVTRLSDWVPYPKSEELDSALVKTCPFLSASCTKSFF
jgi:lipoyl(octanoyl) transferase